MRTDEIHAIRQLFKQLAQIWDQLFYKPSSRATTKDNYTPASTHARARHNIPQLNYMIRQLVVMQLGVERAASLKMDYCFPLKPAKRTLAQLNAMMGEMVERYNAQSLSRKLVFTPL